MEAMCPEEVKQVQVSILKKVDQWCTEHHIQYFLAYGTLLGAVRHKGYIPWDDDIDIVMMRPEYERFIQEFNISAPSGLQVLHSSIDRKFPYEFAKIHDVNTRLVEEIHIPCEIGINIDLFVLDSLPDIENAPQSVIRKKKIVGKIHEWKLYSGNLKRKHRTLKSWLIDSIKSAAIKTPVQWCTRYINHISKKWGGQDSEWVADLCQPSFKTSDVLRREYFQRAILLPFEGLQFQAPEEYDKVLTTWYGNYMQLPPLEQQVTHHRYKAYKM